LLFLDGNSFSGTIPLDFLRHVNNTNTPISVGLSHNNLRGTIPKTLERFESLSIDLVGNPIDEIPPELCAKGGWMGSLVEQFQCDAILCGKNTYNPEGRATTDESPCLPCSSDDSPYLGAMTCSATQAAVDPWHILAEFYVTMAGEKWTLKDGWEIFDTLVNGGVIEDLENLGIDICDGWYGILCQDGKFTRLSLPRNELFGTVPNSIFAISSLQVFDLSNNNVEMPNLKGATNAKNLTSLVLSNIKLQSLDGIEEMTWLEQLYVDGLAIKGPLPEVLFGLTALKTLHLQHGSFTGSFPPSIGQLTDLTWYEV
jgi:Leucine-rich repeat (LRR) protein